MVSQRPYTYVMSHNHPDLRQATGRKKSARACVFHLYFVCPYQINTVVLFHWVCRQLVIISRISVCGSYFRWEKFFKNSQVMNFLWHNLKAFPSIPELVHVCLSSCNLELLSLTSHPHCVVIVLWLQHIHVQNGSVQHNNFCALFTSRT